LSLALSRRIEIHLHRIPPLSSLVPKPWKSDLPPLRARTILCSRKQGRSLVFLAPMLHNCGSERWLSMELVLDVGVSICSSGRGRLGSRNRLRGRLMTRERLAKVVHAKPALARLPHKAQNEQTTLHYPCRGVRRPTCPVRPGPTKFTSSTLC